MTTSFSPVSRWALGEVTRYLGTYGSAGVSKAALFGAIVVHGSADRILPFEATAARLRDEKLIADLTLVEIPNGPHNIGWTFPDEVNAAFLDFLAR